MKRIFIIGVLVCALSLVVYADEELDLGGVTAMWGPDGTGNSQMNMNEPELNGDGETYTMEQEVWDITGNCYVELDLSYDPDPYVLAGLAVTNNAAVPQSFMFTFTAPVSPAIATATYHGGSVGGTYTVNDSDGDGLGSVSTTGMMPLYMGRIDGGDIFPLYSAPQSWGANAGDSGSILNTGTTYPPTILGPAVSTDIEIIIRFTLTPGETATLNGNFYVEPIPEPASLAILGLGALLLGVRRK